MIRFNSDGYVENDTLCDQECNFFADLLVLDAYTGLSSAQNLVDTRNLARLPLPRVLIALLLSMQDVVVSDLLETVPVHQDLTCDMFRQERE